MRPSICQTTHSVAGRRYFTLYVLALHIIEVIYYYVIWTDNGSRLLEADTRRQKGKYPMIKVLQVCILNLSLYSVNTVLILYGTGNMQSAIILLYVTFSSLPSCGPQSTHPLMPCYISPYVVYNVHAPYFSKCVYLSTRDKPQSGRPSKKRTPCDTL